MDRFSQEVRREQLGEGTHDIITPNLTCHPYKTTQACVLPLGTESILPNTELEVVGTRQCWRTSPKLPGYNLQESCQHPGEDRRTPLALDRAKEVGGQSPQDIPHPNISNPV